MHLDGQQLSTQKANTGWSAAKQLRQALLKEISHRFENQLYVDMAVADPRRWTANTVTDSEKQSVVAVEERYGKAVPGLIGKMCQEIIAHCGLSSWDTYSTVQCSVLCQGGQIGAVAQWYDAQT